MPLSDVEKEICKVVVRRFVTNRQPTTRRSLLRQFKGAVPEALSRLVDLTVLKTAPNTGDSYLPWSLAFHLCGDADLLRLAKKAFEVVLRSLRSLYDQDLEHEQQREHTPAEIVVEANKLNIPIETETISVGLYLVEELGLFPLTRPDPERGGIASFQIGERILTIGNIESAWDNHIRQLGTRLERDSTSRNKQPTVSPQSEQPHTSYELADTEASSKGVDVEPPSQPSVYISSVPEDASLRNRIAQKLRSADIRVWDNSAAWNHRASLTEVESSRGHCQVYILVLSFRYLDFDVVRKSELPSILSLPDASRRLLYVIAEPCDWRAALSQPFAVIPPDGSSFSVGSQKQVAAYLDILVREVRRAVQQTDNATSLQSEARFSPNESAYPEAAPKALGVEPHTQASIYISYARNSPDSRWRQRIAAQLAAALFYVPDDPQADSPQHLIAEEELRARSQVFILLVSPHFVDSDEISRLELPHIRSLAQARGRRVICVILEPCAWQSFLDLPTAVVLPDGGSRPLRGGSEEQIKDDLHSLLREVRRAAQQKSRDSALPLPEATRPITMSVGDLVPLSMIRGYSLSSTSEKILDYAKGIASKRKPFPQPLSCSSLLFAFVERGHGSEGIFTAHQFLNKWILSKHEAAYRTAYEAYLDEAGFTALDLSDRMTRNVLGLLNRARVIAEETSQSSSIHSRHLLGSLLVFKPNESGLRAGRRLSSLGFDVSALRKDFLAYLEENVRNDDHDAWVRILSINDDATTPSAPSLGTQLGPSTHVARDRWTTDDTLGHFPYAYAIYRFLTDSKTQPPLAISIQAPWGGGKSSLMRMIQSQLDRDAVKKVEQTSSPTDGNPASAKVRDVLFELERSSPDSKAKNGPRDDKTRFAVPVMEGGKRRRVTIWFNAWKYDSTSQVWAGLADCIVQQIGERLGPIDRELFWFRLQLRRLDIGKIRRRVYEQVFSKFLDKLAPWLLAYAGVAAASLVGAIAAQIARHPWFGWSGFVSTLFAEFFAARRQFAKAKSEVEEKQAKTSLGDIVQAPDYQANLGFLHEVVEDLKRVFEIIPTTHLPMVIFIDDLDRCSPGKVAEVVEAINLFLAGEFPHCMFILGIDDEMVAAALDKAHGDVIAKLPAYAKSTSIGWRFMDKFVQLPFIIPPATTSEIERYTESLLSLDGERTHIDIETRDRAAQIVEQDKNKLSGPEKVVEQVAAREPLTLAQQQTLKKDVVVIEKMSDNINQFSDREKNIRELILSGAKRYSTNPRDLKRFVNLFRFYYFLRAAREGRKEQVPSLEQMCRWIVLSLRWPEVVRWLRHPSKQRSVARSPLDALEELGAASKDIVAWQKGAETQLGLKIGEASWLLDEGLLKFFQGEASSYRKQERLSACAGMGLW